MAMDAGLIHSESLLRRSRATTGPATFPWGSAGRCRPALVTSPNLLAVQLLEAGGFNVADMRNGGVPLSSPALAEPNLALILGGAGSRLEDLVSGYALARRSQRQSAPATR